MDLALPDPSTPSRRAKTLHVPLRQRLGTGRLPRLLDRTGVKLGGAGEGLIEKHGTSRRRSWWKWPIGVDAESGEMIAIDLTRKDSDDGVRPGVLGPVTA